MVICVKVASEELAFLGFAWFWGVAMEFGRVCGCVVVVTLWWLAIVAPSCMGRAEARPQKKINVPAYFVFGDSFADVGTNNYLPNAAARANFPPYGETFFHKPTGRFTNGRNVVDIFGEQNCQKEQLVQHNNIVAQNLFITMKI